MRGGACVRPKRGSTEQGWGETNNVRLGVADGGGGDVNALNMTVYELLESGPED